MQRLAPLAVAFILAILLPPHAACARGDNAMYAVHGIAVDASADNATDAREKAIAQGARKGLEQLLRSLTSPEDAKSLPIVTEKMAAPLVQDFEVESERVSPGRYIATLGFRFRPEGVRALLASASAHFVGARAPPVLMVPVYRSAAGNLLWQPENPWLAAWKASAATAALVPVIVPEGTPEDAQALTAADLEDESKLMALAQKYKADTAVVVFATAVSQTGDPGEGLQLELAGNGATDSFRSEGAPTADATLAKGVSATLDHLDALWKQHVLTGAAGPVAFKGGAAAASQGEAAAAGSPAAPPSGNGFALRVHFSGPGDWSNLRAKLEQLNGVQRVELKSLTRDGAIVQLSVAGDEDRLARILSSGGLSMGTPQAVPGGDSELASMAPSSGPGAGLIYPIHSTGASQ